MKTMSPGSRSHSISVFVSLVRNFELARLEVAVVDRLVELQRCPSGSSVAKHIQARPMLVDQKLIRAHRSGQRSAGIR